VKRTSFSLSAVHAARRRLFNASRAGSGVERSHLGAHRRPVRLLRRQWQGPDLPRDRPHPSIHSPSSTSATTPASTRTPTTRATTSRSAIPPARAAAASRWARAVGSDLAVLRGPRGSGRRVHRPVRWRHLRRARRLPHRRHLRSGHGHMLEPDRGRRHHLQRRQLVQLG